MTYAIETLSPCFAIHSSIEFIWMMSTDLSIDLIIMIDYLECRVDNQVARLTYFYDFLEMLTLESYDMLYRFLGDITVIK